MREHLQALRLRHHRAIIALAPADLRVAVDTHDQHVPELLRLREVLDVPQVHQVEGARGQPQPQSDAPQVLRELREGLQGADQTLLEVDVGAEDAAGYRHGNSWGTRSRPARKAHSDSGSRG